MPAKIEKDAITGTQTTGHEWDGIKELDTPMPKWWLWTFYASIAFAALWVVLYPAIPLPGGATNGILGATVRSGVEQEVRDVAASRAPMMARLQAATPQAIMADPQLREFTLAGGKVLFANTCQGCHGAGGQGSTGGFPSLADDEWIWGGSYEAIEQTITHGIRTPEDDQTRTSQMPRFLADGVLTQPQVNDTAEFVLGLSNRATDQAAATRGQALFADNCASCHGETGRGNRDFGAPSLADQVWLYGSDKASIVQSISYARAGVMPAWGHNNRLSAAQIRMLTVYVHSLGGGQ